MFIRINAALAASRAKRSDDNEKGFTLIELLVVVLIIGILAAIAIPVYIGQQKSAQDAAAKSNVVNAKLAIVAYYAANPSSATDAVDTSALSTYGYPSGSPTVSVATGGTYTSFTVCAVSDSKNGKFTATASTDVNKDAAGGAAATC